jgi:Secretion system C-terminal sorting domain
MVQDVIKWALPVPISREPREQKSPRQSFWIADADLSITNKNALYNLALACPHTKGNIIYNARSLYNFVFPESFTVFQDNCDGPGLYKKDQEMELQNAKLFDAIVYPNPTDDVIYISTNLKTDAEININVTDITGKLITKQTCLTSNNNCSISLGSATKGIYIITITNNKNESIIKKVVLQ